MPKTIIRLLTLTAENSSGKQDLLVEPNHEDGVYFTLVGHYDGEPIQIDFDVVDPGPLKEKLQMLVEQL